MHPVYDILKDEGSCCIKFWKREKVKGQKKQGPDEAGGQLASWKPVGGWDGLRDGGKAKDGGGFGRLLATENLLPPKLEPLQFH